MIGGKWPHFFSHLEMSWLKWPDFFPNRTDALLQKETLCIGTKSRNLGDSLILTPLVDALKAKFPRIRVFSFPRAFNPVVFYSNPSVERVCYFPDQVFGDDCNWDRGHLIHLKEKYFEVPLSTQIKPVIFLTAAEKTWASSFIASKIALLSKKKGLCIIHCSGVTWKNPLSFSFWERIVKRWGERFIFLQVGMRGDVLIPGAQQLLLEKNFWNARKLFAAMSEARAFLGIDSGPMHVARAFSVPSLIWVHGVDPQVVFDRRTQYPYFLFENRRYSNLYEENAHLRMDDCSEGVLLGKVDEFFGPMTKL